MLRLILLAVILNFCNGAPECVKAPTRNDFNGCCPKSDLAREVYSKCMDQFPNQGPKLNFCYGQCLVNDSGLLKNGEIQVDQAPTFFRTIMGANEELVSLAIDSLKKCMQSGSATVAKIQKETPDASKNCNPLVAVVFHCVNVEVFLNCPASIWKNTDTCNQVKDYVKECPLLAAP